MELCRQVLSLHCELAGQRVGMVHDERYSPQQFTSAAGESTFGAIRLTPLLVAGVLVGLEVNRAGWLLAGV